LAWLLQSNLWLRRYLRSFAAFGIVFAKQMWTTQAALAFSSNSLLAKSMTNDNTAIIFALSFAYLEIIKETEKKGTSLSAKVDSLQEKHMQFLNKIAEGLNMPFDRRWLFSNSLCKSAFATHIGSMNIPDEHTKDSIFVSIENNLTKKQAAYDKEFKSLINKLDSLYCDAILKHFSDLKSCFSLAGATEASEEFFKYQEGLITLQEAFNSYVNKVLPKLD
jgi:hypothetical protein